MSENLGSSADSGHYSKIGTYFLYNPLNGKETHDEENITTDLIAEDLSRESFYENIDCAESGTYGTPIMPSLNKNEKVAESGRRIIESVCDDDDGDDRREIPSRTQFGQTYLSCFKLCPSSLKVKILSLSILLVGVVMILVIAVPGVCPYFPSPVLPLEDPDGFGSVTDIQKQKKLFNILFYGDSMLKEPVER